MALDDVVDSFNQVLIGLSIPIAVGLGIALYHVLRDYYTKMDRYKEENRESRERNEQKGC